MGGSGPGRICGGWISASICGGGEDDGRRAGRSRWAQCAPSSAAAGSGGWCGAGRDWGLAKKNVAVVGGSTVGGGERRREESNSAGRVRRQDGSWAVEGSGAGRATARRGWAPGGVGIGLRRSWAVRRGDVGEVVGDVVAANRVQKTGSGDRETRRIGCAGWLSGVKLLISYPGYSIDLLYIYIYICYFLI